MQSEAPLKGVLAMDNTRLIAQVESQGNLWYSIPNTIFKSNWDIVESIVWTVHASSIQVTYTHVKGHQDETTPTNNLDLLTQWSVEADRHTGNFCALHGEFCLVRPSIVNS
jgi:hypothetical protein